jgi:hypothetical protein
MIAIAKFADAQRKQRPGRAQLDDDERADQRDRRSEQRQRAGRAPAVRRAAGERVDEEHQPAGDGCCTHEVEVPMSEVRAALTQEHRCEQCCRDSDGDVDEEDPRPAQVAREEPAEQDADRGAATGRRAVDAEREVALAPFGERGDEQRQRGGREQRSAEPLEGAERDQRRLGPGEAAEQRARGEDEEADHEQAAAPDEVGQPAAEKKGPTEEDGVGGDDPLEARRRETEIGLDRRKRDVDDRDVQDHHELCGHDQREGAPAPGS